MRIAVITVAAADAELAADRLWMAGAQAVEERMLGDHAELLSVLGDDEHIATERLGVLPDGWRLRFDDVDPTPAETWREFASPITVAPDVVVRPAWLAAVGARIEVAIEPGGSFGLGDHPTTRLCAAVVSRLVNGGEAVLDVGCGSGVLSILSLACGAATATAIDIADVAVAATVENAHLNGVADRVRASTTPLSLIEGSFELIVANILAPTLRDMATDLRERLAPNGHLVVSGVLENGYDAVLDALKPLAVQDVDLLDGWAAITLQPA